MLKMFSTQLTGLFMRIADKEEFQFEDGARLLAQAAVGHGAIYFKGFGEMRGVEFEAIEGAEPLESAKHLESIDNLTVADRVIILSRFSNDQEAILLGESLSKKGIPFVSVSGNKEEGNPCLATIADVHIDTRLIKPLLPGDDGNRVGFPSLMAALYIYYALKFIIDDILDDY